MEPRQTLSALAGILVLAGYVPYILSIIRRKTTPAKASWLIWASLDTVLLYGMLLRRVVNGQMVGTVIGIWIVVALSFRFGRKGWTSLDKWCFAITVLGIALIILNPTWSIALLAATSFVGAFPTFRSAWQDPSRENRLTWGLYWISCVFTVLAVPKWTLSAGAQPISFSATQTVMVFLLYVRRRSRPAGGTT